VYFKTKEAEMTVYVIVENIPTEQPNIVESVICAEFGYWDKEELPQCKAKINQLCAEAESDHPGEEQYMDRFSHIPLRRAA
jgi:hypothetical protein